MDKVADLSWSFELQSVWSIVIWKRKAQLRSSCRFPRYSRQSGPTLPLHSSGHPTATNHVEESGSSPDREQLANIESSIICRTFQPARPVYHCAREIMATNSDSPLLPGADSPTASPRSASVSLQAAATMNAGLQREPSRRTHHSSSPTK